MWHDVGAVVSIDGTAWETFGVRLPGCASEYRFACPSKAELGGWLGACLDEPHAEDEELELAQTEDEEHEGCEDYEDTSYPSGGGDSGGGSGGGSDGDDASDGDDDDDDDVYDDAESGPAELQFPPSPQLSPISGGESQLLETPPPAGPSVGGIPRRGGSKWLEGIPPELQAWCVSAPRPPPCSALAPYARAGAESVGRPDRPATAPSCRTSATATSSGSQRTSAPGLGPPTQRTTIPTAPSCTCGCHSEARTPRSPRLVGGRRSLASGKVLLLALHRLLQVHSSLKPSLNNNKQTEQTHTASPLALIALCRPPTPARSSARGGAGWTHCSQRARSPHWWGCCAQRRARRLRRGRRRRQGALARRPAQRSSTESFTSTGGRSGVWRHRGLVVSHAAVSTPCPRRWRLASSLLCDPHPPPSLLRRARTVSWCSRDCCCSRWSSAGRGCSLQNGAPSCRPSARCCSTARTTSAPTTIPFPLGLTPTAWCAGLTPNSAHAPPAAALAHRAAG
eukprot:SAG11_NODE_628_length_8077_cov_4.820632_2_plen_509_part_00